MKIVQTLIFLSLLVATNALSQLRALSCEGSKKITQAEGEALISKAQSTYQNLSSLKGTFDQESYMAALDISEIASGHMWFERPGKMRWEYEYPHKQDFIINDSTFWFYQPEQKQVLINKIEKAFLSDVPVSFLLGVGSLKETFSFDSGCTNSDGVVLMLKKKQGDENIKSFALLVTPDAALPRGARIEDVGGNITSIVIRTPVINQTFESKMFKADIPEGTDIADQRGIFG